MKKSILFFVIIFLALNQYCKGQLIIFGVDITKYKPSEHVTEQQNCTPNPYFIFASWRSDEMIIFECYTAKNKTPQMKEPAKYMKELYTKLSNTLGQPFYTGQGCYTFYPNGEGENGKNICKDAIIWRFKYQNVYYILNLHPFSNWGFSLTINFKEDYDSIVSDYKNGKAGTDYKYTSDFNEEEFFKFPDYVPKK